MSIQLTFMHIHQVAMEQKEWYETWFDSPYYHVLYQNRDEEEAEQFIDNLLSHLRLPANSRVLDVACGKGRHAVYLAEKDLDVTGIDLSWRNISHARHLERNNLSFFLHDMRRIFYVNYFDVVFNLFTSFGYFESEKENQKAVHSMSLALKKGGQLVIDFFNAGKITRDLVSQEYVTRNGLMFLVKKQLEGKVISKKIYLQDRGKEYEFEERVQTLDLSDFRKYFEKSKIQIKDVFGDYQLNSYDENSSDRMIIIAEKN